MKGEIRTIVSYSRANGVYFSASIASDTTKESIEIQME